MEARTQSEQEPNHVPAQPWIGDPEIWSREGRIAFAASDFAENDAGWFEGAIRSGEAAALAVRPKA